MNTRLFYCCHLLAAIVLRAECTGQASQVPAAAIPSLQEVYKGDFLIGAALNTAHIQERDEKAALLIPRQFNAATPENIMKAQHIHPEWDKYAFELPDKLIEYGKRNGIAINGHTLIWHSQLPGFVRRIQSVDSFRTFFTNHISTVAGRYRGKVQSWDVVNEALNEDGSMRQSVFWQRLGPGFVTEAFRLAAEASPGTELYYNDYNNEQPAKRAGCIQLIKKIQEAGVRIDGVGIQGHWQVGKVPFRQIEESIAQYAALGIKVAFTELDLEVLPRNFQGADVNQRMQDDAGMNPYKNGLPDSVQQQLAQDYENLFRLFLKHKDNISRITFWGVTDGDSWLNGWPVRGRTNYPLLFDRNYQPKPAFYKVVEVKKNNGKPNAASQAQNPVIFADVPDISVIRVGKVFYMSSTTMHMSPGVPIMKSTDLVNWKLVSYAYDTLADVDELNLANNKNTYGRGSWASSLRFHNGTYYVSTFAQTTGKTYIFSTKDIEKGPWKISSFRPMMHDHSLFFDDDGKIYMLYGAGKLRLVELKEDLSGVQPGTEQVVIDNASLPAIPAGTRGGLPAEGSQLYKVNGRYYLFNIAWPPGGMRTVIIHRADNIHGPYEGRIGLQDLGVAQGGLVDMPNGQWYACLFRDYGAVGRIPYLVPVTWQNGWPELGAGGKVPETLELPASNGLIPGIVRSDDFDRRKGEAPLPLAWQWNHNPDNRLWSVTARKGYLRLTTGRIDSNFLQARNTLTQRTIGPVCSGAALLDVAHMKEGDFAGLGLLQKNYGLAGVKMEGHQKRIVMVGAETGQPAEWQTLPLAQEKVYLKATCDFTGKKDMAQFFYSLDGKSWTALGRPLKMAYTIPQFMGYRFALFNYATRQTGGWVDIDFFHVSDY